MTKPNLIDFDKLNQHLLGAGETFLRYLFPNGVLRGHEWCVGSIHGEAGDSLKVNVHSGKWSDFAIKEHRGNDLISLYATINNLEQVKAARELMEYLHIAPNDEPRPRPPVDTAQICIPPLNADPPTFVHSRHGHASKTWPYTDADGRVMFYVARYSTDGGRKEFCPWSWSDSKGRWVTKGFPGKKPLYRLAELRLRPDAPVLITEGEKAADAAHAFAGKTYIVVTWAGGAQATDKTDFEPLAGRDILLWPDADKPGVECMRNLAIQLRKADPKTTVKILNVDDLKNGWDAADSGFDWPKFKAWAKPRATVFEGGQLVQLDKVREAAKLRTPEIAAPSDQWTTWDRANVVISNGRPVENMDNVCRMIRHLGEAEQVYFDEFHGKTFRGKAELTDADILALTVRLQSEYGFRRMSDETVYKAFRAIAFEQRRDTLMEWFQSLKWDGIRRNATFFPDIYGAESTDYTQAVGVNFLRSIAARATRPGCKVDNMVVLEGRQGIGKSESLSILGGGLHTEIHEAIENKDFYTAMQGKLLVCFSELATFSNMDMRKLKGIITNKVDRYRAPYGRTTEDHPRRCVFVGDTNEDQWHDDHTGARRFWPIRCREINWDALRKNREQYFAEAMHDLNAGATWHEFGTAAVAVMKEQEDRRIKDVWEVQIKDFLLGHEEITSRDILIDCLRFEIAKITRADQLRVGRVLKVLGWKNKIIRDGGNIYRGFVRQTTEGPERDD